jgi:hypothetical protein
MPETFEMSVKRELLEHASLELHINYGIAMERWSALEQAMYLWFEHLTGLKREVASAIFYCARGFFSRAEMLESLIEVVCDAEKIETQIMKEGIKKARNYSGFRNKLAHGERLLNIHQSRAGDTAHYVITQGKSATNPKADEITIQHMQIAADNVRSLHKAMLSILPVFMNSDEALSPAECLATIRSLPNQPQNKSAPTPSAPAQSDQGPVHRNKKAHRAGQSPPEDD